MEVIDLTGEESPQVVRNRSRNHNRNRNTGEGNNRRGGALIEVQAQNIDDVQFVKETPAPRSSSRRAQTNNNNNTRGSNSRNTGNVVPAVIIQSETIPAGNNSNSNANTQNLRNEAAVNIINSVPAAAQQNTNTQVDESPLTCPICFDKFDQPSTTPCGHIFCTKCLMDCLSRNSVCPKCRCKVTKKKVIRVYIG